MKGFILSTQTHTDDIFAMLTNPDGKSHAVILIVYEWLWMVGHNVIKRGLYG